MRFSDKLIETSCSKGSLLCIGLDVEVERVPQFLLKSDDPILQFNKTIIDATSDLSLAYKLNVGFYEAYGIEGWQALKATADYIPGNVIKIADAKRGDIANTSRMYAKAFFQDLGFDAVTVNPYLGRDSVEPFIENEEKGAFFLCLTSNPGARDIQYFSDGQKRLFELVAEKVRSWNQKGNCGLVVGATYPEELKRIRDLTPELAFLIPGIGAQRGDLELAVKYGTDDKGELALFNSSRGIIYRSSGEDFANAAREEALRLRDEINRIRRLL